MNLTSIKRHTSHVSFYVDVLMMSSMIEPIQSYEPTVHKRCSKPMKYQIFLKTATGLSRFTSSPRGALMNLTSIKRHTSHVSFYVDIFTMNDETKITTGQH